MAANAAIIILFFINIPNSRCKICDNSVIITIFANQKKRRQASTWQKASFLHSVCIVFVLRFKRF